MERLLDVKVLGHSLLPATDYTALQVARQTAEDTDGVQRIIGLVSAEKSYDMRSGAPVLMFRFSVEA